MIQISLGSSGQTDEGRGYRDHDEDREQHLGDTGRSGGNAGKAEYGSDDRHYKERKGITQHDVLT
jgi:hypothetical protein